MIIITNNNKKKKKKKKKKKNKICFQKIPMIAGNFISDQIKTRL
jgi:hypothetical protein